MPDYRLMPGICSLTVRAMKLGIDCPYPMGGTHFNTGTATASTQSFGANPRVPLGQNEQHQAKKPPGCSCLAS